MRRLLQVNKLHRNGDGRAGGGGGGGHGAARGRGQRDKGTEGVAFNCGSHGGCGAVEIVLTEKRERVERARG